MGILIMYTLLCKIAQLFDESVLEITLDKDIDASVVPESETLKGGIPDVLLQVANLPEESLETEMSPNIPPELKSDSEPPQAFQSDYWGITTDDFLWSEVSAGAHSTSESGIDDFEAQVNIPALGKTPFPIMAMHILNYLRSVTVNLNSSC